MSYVDLMIFAGKKEKQTTLELNGKGVFGWDFKSRTILATHTFDLVDIKRSWHSTEGGSVIVGVERVSVTKQIFSMHRVNGEE